MFSLYEYDYEGQMNLVREEGFADGTYSEKEKVITNMLNNNCSPETVAQLTGYSLDDVKKVQSKNLEQATQQQ